MNPVDLILAFILALAAGLAAFLAGRIVHAPRLGRHPAFGPGRQAAIPAGTPTSPPEPPRPVPSRREQRRARRARPQHRKLRALVSLLVVALVWYLEAAYTSLPGDADTAVALIAGTWAWAQTRPRRRLEAP